MRMRLRIAGMVSPHCVQAVFLALTPVEGITSADVRQGEATLDHDGRATPDAVRAAIAVAGYEIVEIVEERRALPVV